MNKEKGKIKTKIILCIVLVLIVAAVTAFLVISKERARETEAPVTSSEKGIVTIHKDYTPKPTSQPKNTPVNTKVPSVVTEDSEEQEILKFIPDNKNNIDNDARLNIVSVGGNDIDILFSTVGEFKEKTGFSKQIGALIRKKETFQFKGQAYGLSSDSTILFVEAIKDNELVTPHLQDDDCEIIGVCSSAFFTEEGEERYILFAGGIHVGMTREEIESIYGKGSTEDEDPSGDTIVYKNNLAALVITYEDGTASKIYLLKNNE
jgi:vacuolar-type H+-ATPase subunit F/Vma7